MNDVLNLLGMSSHGMQYGSRLLKECSQLRSLGLVYSF